MNSSEADALKLPTHETLIGLALFHAVGILLLDVFTRELSFRHGSQPGPGLAFFGLLMASLLILPGAFLGWHFRGKSLSLRPWLSFVVPYWFLVAMLSSFICFIPNAANPAAYLYGVLAVMMLSAGNAQSETLKRQRRQSRRLELSQDPVGDRRHQ